MVKKLKVTATFVGYYQPDLKNDYYTENEVTSLDEAIQIDFKDLKEGNITIYDLCSDDLRSSTYKIEVVDEDA